MRTSEARFVVMLGRYVFWWVTVLSCGTALAVPKSSPKRELQGLVRSPRVEFATPLEFHRRAGFVAFAEESAALADAARLLKEATGSQEDAGLHLRAAQTLDSQGDATGAMRQYAQAIDLFRKRLEVSPEETKSLAGLGEALAALGRFSEAQAVLDRAGDKEDVTLWLARAKLYRERAWFTAAGEAVRYSSSSFLDQLIGLVALSPEPARVEESKRFLQRAEETMVRAFQSGSVSKQLEVDRLLQRAAFRSFQSAMEAAFEQMQNAELKSRTLRTSIFARSALHDLIAAAELSDDPAIITAAALAGAIASEAIADWAPKGEAGTAEFFARRAAIQLRRLIETGGENSNEAAEFLGCLQLQLLKDARGAERSLRQALAIDPNRYRSWEMLSLAAAQQGTEKFVHVAEERAAALPQARSVVLQVKAHERSGDHLRAAWVALNGVGSYPNDWLVNLTLAAMLLKDENAEVFLWRVEEALKKAEKGLGTTSSRQQRLDFVLVKSVFLGLSNKTEDARKLLDDTKPLTPELLEVRRVLDESSL